jgi:hypothetical protein
MRTLAPSRRLLAVVVAVALSPLSVSAAPAPSAPPASDADAALSPVEKARQGLDRPVTLKIDRQTLAQTVAQLSAKAKVRIVLDVQAITGQLGSAPDGTPVQTPMDLKDVKVRAALRTLLAPYNLTFVIVGDSVVVTTEDAAAAQQMGQHVSVNFDKVDLAAALKQIARETAVNIALDPRAEKEAMSKVSLQVEDVPLETAVRLLAEMAGLKPVRADNALFVTKKDVAAEMRGDPDLNPRSTNVFMNADIDSVRAVRLWQVQRRVQPIQYVPVGPIDGAVPVPKQSEESPPAPPDPTPAPEKKDSDK